MIIDRAILLHNFSKVENSRHKKMRSLFYSKVPSYIDLSAPYLLEFHNDNELKEVLNQIKGSPSFVIVGSKHLSFDELARHLRKFLITQIEDGRKIYFRFYDPRVLHFLLPLFDPNQSTLFFEKIDYMVLENSKQEDMTMFSVNEDGIINQEIVFI